MPTFARGEHPCGRERISAFGLFFANRVFQDLMIKFTAARSLWVLLSRNDWPRGHLVAFHGLIGAQLLALAAPMSLNSGQKNVRRPACHRHKLRPVDSMCLSLARTNKS